MERQNDQNQIKKRNCSFRFDRMRYVDGVRVAGRLGVFDLLVGLQSTCCLNDVPIDVCTHTHTHSSMALTQTPTIDMFAVL